MKLFSKQQRNQIIDQILTKIYTIALMQLK